VRLSSIDPGALIASAVAHCVLVASGAWLWAGQSEVPPQNPSLEVEIEEAEPPREVRVPSGKSQLAHVEITRSPEPVSPGGGEHAPRPDVGTPGRGGSREGDRASNLSSSIDPLTLEREPPNHLRRSEVQRLASARVRRTRDDRRATPHPMELDFVASGRGHLALRRPPADFTPAAGFASGAVPLKAGAIVGADPGEDAESAIGAQTLGAVPNVTRGVANGTGARLSTSAAVVTARPWVQRDRAAVPAADRGRPSDTLDSRQRVESRIRALLQASTAGAESGHGIGGEPAASTPAPMIAASGGEIGTGARSSPSGHGPGSLRDLAGDPGLQVYGRTILARLDGVLRDAFPRWAIAEGRGGVVEFELTLLEDGRLAQVAVVRPSGIDEYDRNVLIGVRKVPSFGRIPSVFGRRAVFRIAWDSLNPVVGRRGPGPGQRPE